MIDLSNLSQDEIKKLSAAAISLITEPEKGIGSDLFEAVIKIVPQVAVEALIVDDINHPKKILVTWRKDKNYTGWHFPGGFIRFGSSFEKTLHDVVKKKTGVKIRRIKDTGIKYSETDKRGHTVGLVFLVELAGKPTIGKWFNSTPEKLLKHHKFFLKEAIGWK